MKKLAIMIAVLVVFTGSTAAADKPATFSTKSPGMASSLSLFSTLLPIGAAVAVGGAGGGGGTAVIGSSMFFAGTIFGPGVGHAYAGNGRRFWIGAGLRTLGYGGMLAVIAATWNSPDADWAYVPFIACAGLVVVSTIVDIAAAGKSANDYNERHSNKQLSLAPTYDPRDSTTGLRLTMSF